MFYYFFTYTEDKGRKWVVDVMCEKDEYFLKIKKTYYLNKM